MGGERDGRVGEGEVGAAPDHVAGHHALPVCVGHHQRVQQMGLAHGHIPVRVADSSQHARTSTACSTCSHLSHTARFTFMQTWRASRLMTENMQFGVERDASEALHASHAAPAFSPAGLCCKCYADSLREMQMEECSLPLVEDGWRVGLRRGGGVDDPVDGALHQVAIHAGCRGCTCVHRRHEWQACPMPSPTHTAQEVISAQNA